jgi:phosphatidylglycerophosphate synthase
MGSLKVPVGQIKGSTRKRTHLLAEVEDRFINWAYAFVPSFVQTNHLTLVSLLFSGLLILVGFLARGNRLWLICVSILIEAHYVTDALDGETGRRRDTGLVRWGFYADHFLDLLFAGAILAAYMLGIPGLFLPAFCIYVFFSLFFLDSSLYALVGAEYTTSGFLGKIGPTELSQVLVFLNIFIVFLPEYVIVGLFWAFAALLFVGLSVNFYARSKDLWERDMKDKL